LLASRLLVLIGSICEARELLKGRNEASLIIVFATRHYAEDFTHHHIGK
jgi:hypothetical protein